MKKFPDGFLWGAATSSYQVEGGIENCDYAQAGREHRRVPPYLEKGWRVVSAGVAADHYNRYEEDFDIAKSLNHTAHRFSIEWARIEPEEGKFDEAEIAHYQEVVRALRARGMEPFVTLQHFTLPLWFSESGGWSRRDAPQIFERYALKVAAALQDEVTFFVTINEPGVWFGEHALVLGARKRFFRDPITFFRIVRGFTEAHKQAYRALKHSFPHLQIGFAHHVFAIEGRGFIGAMLAWCLDIVINRSLVDAVRSYQDFIGLQYYLPIFIFETKEDRATLTKTDIGWYIYPKGMYQRLMQLVRYQVPIYITENGIADAKDQWRAQFIVDTLHEVHRAIADGAPVKGYFHWSLLDNYEWWRGYSMRFGLVHIDYENSQKRTVRESAKVYADIAKNNAI